ncbi:MAG: beta-ketoacyl-ACP synthase [Cyanobacteria bacterium J083]|nr:MAG: beta-ketoacyl-ACP synthase [Cyanobacteria bacterium J083]
MDVVVTGIGLLCCLGNLTQTWQRLLLGESGIKRYQPFSEISTLPLGLIETQPLDLGKLTEKLLEYTLKDADLHLPLPEIAVIIGSSRGCQASWENFLIQAQPGQNFSTGLLDNWLDTLPHQSAIAVASYLGAKGIVLAPTTACTTGLYSLAKAYQLIRHGDYERVIAGAVETPVTRLTIAGFERMKALAKRGCYPFDRQREGLVLGEGGAFFVLESGKLARQRKAKIYGRILGFGLSCDAENLTAPSSSGFSSAIAIKQCLAMSQLKPEEIDLIHSHGTSTKLNDANEANLVSKLFNNFVPVTASKGSTGHSLGASGAITAALNFMALQEQILPPCVGLLESDFSINLIKKAKPAKINHTLCFSFGFGGQNAILAISKVS